MVVLELLAGVGGKVDMVGYPLALIPKWSLDLKQKFQREEMKKEPAQKQSLDNIYKRVCGNKLYRWQQQGN